MKTHTESDEYHVNLYSDDLISLKTYLEVSGLKYKKTNVIEYSTEKREKTTYDLIGNLKQLYKLVSDLVQTKSVRVITNESGNIKDISVNGFNKNDTIELLKHAQEIIIHEKQT